VGLEMISFLSSNLWALQILNINGCFLKEVPHRIGKLSSLRQLHMASNILTSLKDELGELKGLEIVDLGFNGSLDIDH
jgi:Leucine-rich repeat (LRR) protein